MKTIETPRRFRSRTRSKKYFFSSGVRLAVGSSKMMIFALMQHRARDFDHLFLRGAEQSDRRRRRHVEIERLQELLRGDVDAAQSVVEPLLAEEQVLRHRHRRNQAVLLEHHGDAEMARLQRRSRRDRPAVDEHRARGQRHHARHDLGQRRLARAVLADQRVNLAAPQLEIDAVDRRDAPNRVWSPCEARGCCRSRAPSPLRAPPAADAAAAPAPWRGRRARRPPRPPTRRRD